MRCCSGRWWRGRTGSGSSSRRASYRPRRGDESQATSAAKPARRRFIDVAWTVLLALAVVAALVQVWRFIAQGLSAADIVQACLMGVATLARIVVLISLASAIWVPIGVWVGTRPRATRLVQPIAQFLAAFPANLLFPIVVSVIVAG